MLSTKRCREIIDRNRVATDENINEIRDVFMVLADVVLDLAETQDAAMDTDQFCIILEDLPDEDREALEERIAIREFDGDMNRDEAGRCTLTDYLRGRMN